MTPKEKAQELVHSFLTAAHGTIEEYVPVPNIFAKVCASLAVDEIIKHSPNKPVEKFDPIDYFKKVKQEIINL